MINHKLSAGILFYKPESKEVFLVHPGGPFNKNKDFGFWSIPKGEPDENEELIHTAIREANEELSISQNQIDKDKLEFLGEVKQKSGKVVHAWLYEVEEDFEIDVDSNNTKIEFPPRSGKYIEIPEVDRGEWFNLEIAAQKMNSAQAEFLQKL